MYKSTKLWINAFEPKDDGNDKFRERLSLSYEVFRERVGQLIQTIPSEIKGLTVHDLTHLDALWQMADLLIGEDYPLNPAEVYVLGGAILLHDSAMTICAYRGGAEEIRKTPEYMDALAQVNAFLSVSKQNQSGISTESDQYAISEALRIKHASKAEELASQSWISPIDEKEVYLIDELELRNHYSCSIGRIAHSHHWNIADIPKKLGSSLGAFSSFPSNWTVNQVKVALILRCADAMHIDDRRAPNFLSAIRTIGSVSLEHWKFQNLLTVPQIQDSRLIYTSKRPFNLNEAPAWNLCFDTMQMIERELRDARDLHLQKEIQEFKAYGVAGSSSAPSLAKYIEVSGWQPLPLNLKVSNVSHLAKTLGGRDLYNNPLAPLRELIQNAADAIEARTVIEDDFDINDGLITVRFIENATDTILQVDDNGIGMSEQVLTNALLDFGYSFWKSSAARSEFPGLQQEISRFRGRYGIGFFSVFMWSNEVIVCSRRFNDGVDNVKVLEFSDGLESRPILRPANTGEKSTKWTTRLQLKIKSDFLRSIIQPSRVEHRSPFIEDYVNRESRLFMPTSLNSWVHALRMLCGTLLINVRLESDGRTSAVSLPHWRNCDVQEFMDFFSDAIFKRDLESNHFDCTLTELTEPHPFGGRCFISPYQGGLSRVAMYDKGIFVCFSSDRYTSGVVESPVLNAARDKPSQFSVMQDKQWINAVRTKAFSACKHIGERIETQRIFVKLDQPDHNQPMFIRNRELITLSEMYRKLREENTFYIRLNEKSDKLFEWSAANSLSILHKLVIDESRIYPLFSYEGKVAADSDIRELIEHSSEPLFVFLKSVVRELGENADIKCEYHLERGYREDYIDIYISAEPIS